ncbi:cytochrome P450 [Mycena maculata]|uniref:Cytochrome P450 n=1 Tax=Mycena maculata TaxID=230809 RepID=A0AAD7I0H3_9AGAR|nr:cytochrome P450 [Mycena maculata]
MFRRPRGGEVKRPQSPPMCSSIWSKSSREFSYPLRGQVGPKNSSFIYGNVKEIEDDPLVTRKWRDEIGPTFLFKGVFNTRQLYTADPIAIDHMLKADSIYQKGITKHDILFRLGGPGLLGVEGEDHKRQRRVMNPAFGTAQIRGLTGIFVDKSVELRDIWVNMIRGHTAPQHIDVYSWLSKMTLDVIAQSGFGTPFKTLNPKARPNPVYQALERLFRAPNGGRESLFHRIVQSFPILLYLPVPARKHIEDTRRQLFVAGSKLLADSKAAINAAGGPKSASGGRDLFSLLLRANMSPDIPDHHRMSEAEVIAQIPTFFIAGHATTSAAIAFALHALSMNKPGLPYLESVIRETLRLYAPVSHVPRLAIADDVLPLRTPCVDRNGKVHTSLPVPRGQRVRIAISDLNTDTSLWGPDAGEFRPERWEKIPEALHQIPGVWGNMLTFLAGPHNCIGFRFSLAEQKVLLFVLIRAFEFDGAVPSDDIGRRSTPLQVPFVHSARQKGSQLPLLVRAYEG